MILCSQAVDKENLTSNPVSLAITKHNIDLRDGSFCDLATTMKSGEHEELRASILLHVCFMISEILALDHNGIL